MKKSRLIILSFLMLFALFNTSCKKDVAENTETEQSRQESEVVRSVVTSFRSIASQSTQNGSSVNQTQSALNSYFCFDFVYPISIVYNDGTTQSLADDNEFAQAIVDQTAGHYIIDFVYPFDVLQNGSTITINNDVEFENLINSCTTITPVVPIQSTCFDYVYPISIEMSDGSTVVVNNDTELDNLFMNANNNLYPVDIVYPFDVIQNGQSLTINNSVEFNALLDSCYGCGVVASFMPPSAAFDQCFDLNYPLDLMLDDGTTITVNNNTEYDDAIFAMTPPFVVDFVYPVSATDDNGTTYTFNDIYEFSQALMNCSMSPAGGSQLPVSYLYDCVDLVYPVTIIMSDGTTQVANDVNEYDAIVGSTNTSVYAVDFQYPVNISYNGQTYTVNSLDEIFINYVSNCAVTPSSYTASVCFTFNYPINILDGNGNIYVANDDQELDYIMNSLYPNGNQFPWLDQYTSAFEFPVTVDFNGSQVVINDWNDYYNLLNSCN